MRAFHGGDVREASTEFHLPINTIIDFSANINPLGLSPRIKQTIYRNLDLISQYPDPECTALKQALAHHLQIRPANLLIGNGAVDLIYQICRALLPEQALIVAPTFSEYEQGMKSIRKKSLFIIGKEKDGFQLPVTACLKFLSRIDVIFISNPNNPVGYILAKDELLFLIEACQKRNVLVVIDEAFIDFVENSKRLTLCKQAAEMENLIVLRSLTKFFAIPGLRLGFLVGHEKLLRYVSQFQVPWSVNALAQLAGQQALNDAPYIERSKRYLRKQRQLLLRGLRGVTGIEPYPTSTNFIFCKLSHEMTSKKLRVDLAKRSLLVRDCSTFRGLNDKFIRVAVRKKQDNSILIRSLKEILKNGR